MKEAELEVALEILTEGFESVVSMAAAEKLYSQKDQSAVERVQVKARPWILGRGIQGIGLGEQLTDGMPTGDLALLVYVDKKKPAQKVRNKIPRRVAIPNLGTAQIDVVEIGELRFEAFTQKVRPAMPGCGVSHYQGSAGTMGLAVRRTGDDRTYLLSNSHVLARSGRANPGHAIVQRCRLDGGRRDAEKLGELADWVPFEFSDTRFPNTVDAAVAKVRKTSVTNLIREVATRPVGFSDDITRDMPVYKVGRTTGHTTGIVKDIHAKIHRMVVAGNGRRRRVGWSQQVRCTRFTDTGDSGSAVLDTDDRVVGLHFMGSDGASFFNRMGLVVEQLNLERVLPD